MLATLEQRSDARHAVGVSFDAWWPGRERLRPDFRIDRRGGCRWAVRGTATMLALGVDLGVLVELDALECAPWWLAGSSITPITVGTRVTIGFSHPHCRPSTAIVERCERRPGAEGYRIAVRFDGGLAL